MGEGSPARLIAWNRELTTAHSRLRAAIEVARESLDEPETPARDLLLFCHGFCTALNAHHRGEDRELFAEVTAQHPALAPVVAQLKQDHAMIEHLLGAFAQALDAGAPRAELERHLDGIGAIMESHFRYEERQLLDVLADLDWDGDPASALGPL
jgi:hypothetical protein